MLAKKNIQYGRQNPRWPPIFLEFLKLRMYSCIIIYLLKNKTTLLTCFSLVFNVSLKLGDILLSYGPCQMVINLSYCPYPRKSYHYLPLYPIIEYVSKNKTCFTFICQLTYKIWSESIQTIVSYCPFMKFCHFHFIAQKVIFCFTPKVP